MDKRQQQILAYTFGVAFLLIMLAIAIFLPKPSRFQFFVFRVVLALAAAGTAAMIPGFLQVQVSKFLRAGGALAVFALVYLYNPASLVSTPEVPFKSSFHFRNANIKAQVEDGQQAWSYGFSSLERDPAIVGTNVILKKVKVSLDVDCAASALNMDVWALFGGTDFGLPVGQITHGGYPPFFINGANGQGNPTPPTQLKVGIGGDRCPSQIWAQYEFATGARSGAPGFSSLKESFNPPMRLTEGLFAQLFVWTGDPRYAVQVYGATVEAEGTLIEPE
jgi:hypothetical protein